MGDYYGYLILGIFCLYFSSVYPLSSQKKKFPAEGVDDFVAAGRGIPSALIAASVMVSWVWTTTLMGSAEAGMNFWYLRRTQLRMGQCRTILYSDPDGYAFTKENAKVHNLYRIYRTAIQ